MKKTTVLLLLTMIIGYAQAQESVEPLASLSEKKFFKQAVIEVTAGDDFLEMLNSRQMTLEDMPDIRKIGLLSIFQYDPAFRRGQRGGVVYNHNPVENEVAGGIAAVSLPSLTDQLKAMEVRLLTPRQYLSDDDLKDTYEAFSLNYQRMDAAKRFGEFFTRNPDAKGAPLGYRVIYATYENGKPRQIRNSLGQLTADLGLDALLTIEITTASDEKTAKLEAIKVTLHGPHPKFYDKGMLYGTAAIYPEDDFRFIKINSDSIEADYNGFEKIITRLVTTLVSYLKEDLSSIE